MANRTFIANAAASFLSSALVNLPLLPGMHPTTGWLLCQKMRSTLSSRSLRHLRWVFAVIVVSVVIIVVAVVIVVEITPPHCQECIRPQVGCCVKK